MTGSHADRMMRTFLARTTRFYATDTGRRQLDAERPHQPAPAIYHDEAPISRAQMLALIDADHAHMTHFRAAITNERHAA